MAIFKRITQQELRDQFTHYGLMYGWVPVYVGQPDSDAPMIAVRNWWPDWLLDLADELFHVCADWKCAVDPDYVPEFFFTVTGEIEK